MKNLAFLALITTSLVLLSPPASTGSSACNCNEILESRVSELEDELEALRSRLAALNPKDDPDVEEAIETPQKASEEPQELGTLPVGYTLEFWTAPWCGSCARFKTSELSQFRDGEVRVMNYDRRRPDAKRLGITSLPTFRVVSPDGRVRHTIRGYSTAKSIQSRVRSWSNSTVQASPYLRDQWGTYNPDTYNPSHRHCNCAMCATRRARAQASLPAGQQPAPMNAVNDAIRSLQLAPADTIADLGCGDGRALIAAVQSSGCRAVGVEIDSERAELARRNVDAAGLSDKITIFTGDATDFDLQGAGVTHVYLYLFSDLLEKLSPKLKGYPVASAFHEIPGWSGKKVGSVWAYNI